MQVVAGVYQLRIRLERPATIRIGALGRCRLPAGWYLYMGSARNGLLQRVARHLRRRKHRHRHIDYLLEAADGVEAFVLPGIEVTECEIHRGLRGGSTLVVGFGSSDCRCRSHLACFDRRPRIDLMPLEELLRGLGTVAE